MLAPLATALLLSVSTPGTTSQPRPTLLAENAATEAHPTNGEPSSAATSHGTSQGESSPARGEASGRNPTGAPNPVTPWSGVGANGVSGTNQH